MTTEAWNRVQEAFDRVVTGPPANREAVLDEVCCGDAALRAEVEALLEHDSRAGDDFLAPPKLAFGPTRNAPRDWAQRFVGRKIGRYTIARLIAAGGMGCVFEALQEQPSRVVALKVLQPGLSAPSALARFQLEPEVLARLQHPNIAQVFEAGLHEYEQGAVPYFAMEYIPNAQSLLDYANLHLLTTRQRLTLFALVCDAVHYGHQKGIIHRDLKPANILIGADGDPKLIDFGVARASDADIVVTTQYTNFGDLIGTVRYMSPEQCDGDPGVIDTRTDIYSLGVVLYELLTGAAPYDTGGTTVYKAIRVIKEEVPRPPSQINRRLRGDVEAILLKTLEKEPARRYASAAELAQDIRRHLAGEPIEARPPTRWTRAVRCVSRHPILASLTTSAAILIAAVSMTFVLVWWVNQRPYRMVLVKRPGYEHFPYAQEARLEALSGRPLKAWSGPTPRTTNLAELVDRPRQLGGGKVAIALLQSDPGRYDPPLLRVYDTRVSLDVPEWTGDLRDGEPLPDPHGRGYTARQFSCIYAGLFDVFPQHAGTEMVTCHVCEARSQSIIRIYDLRGDVLYEVWHDGPVGSCCWMADAGLLVFGALNAEVYWEDRGYEGVEEPHAKVIFAIRPRYRQPQHEFLTTRPGDGPSDPAWYRCLWPPELVGSRENGWDVQGFDGPLRGAPGRSAVVRVRCRAGYSFWFEIDEHGHEIPETRSIDDTNRRALNAAATQPTGDLPDYSLISLQNLPPIVAQKAN